MQDILCKGFQSKGGDKITKRETKIHYKELDNDLETTKIEVLQKVYINR